MLIPKFFELSYRYILKPILFRIDPELVHDGFTKIGESLENLDWLVGGLLRYQNPKLNKTILGITFSNPVGLSAGFDYDGHMAKVMRSVGFGFNTVGTVTAKSYPGNASPRLARLPKSRSLLVNKGFKSSGAKSVRERLDSKDLSSSTIGISIGSSNVPELDTVTKAIDDYLATFKLFKDRNYVKYFELNISCPNIKLKGAFTDPKNFNLLCQTISNLHLSQPIFVKMPNEIEIAESDKLVNIAIKHNIRGFIFSNLVKDRNNPTFDKSEIARVSGLAGNFSGKPTSANSLKLIKHTRQKFGNKIVIIGTGGIFSTADAKEKLDNGADLVQLITGMVFEGPQLIGQINRSLST